LPCTRTCVRQRVSGLFMVKPIAGKEERFNGCLGEVEAGYVLLPSEAPWLQAFKHELRAFPDGKYDDQAESFGQFVQFQMRHWKWLLQERSEKARIKDRVRLRRRPW